MALSGLGYEKAVGRFRGKAACPSSMQVGAVRG
jgi:hypothetical protein